MKRLVFTFLLAAAFVVCVPSAVSAAEVSLTGLAEVLSTGHTFDFDQYNSDVKVDSSTGDLTGHVWSEDLGWVDFDNNGEADSAKVNLTTGKLSGQAYTSNTGTHLHFTNYNSDVEVELSTGGISGYAWSEDLGWVSFSTVEVAGGLLPLQDTGQNVLPLMLMSGGLMGAGVYVTKRKTAK